MLFILLNLLFALLIFYLVLSFITGAPFVPSSKKAIDSMLRQIKIKPGTVVFDLGSGDGRILFRLAKYGARAIGYEINPYLVILTQFKKLFSPYRKSITVRWGNFWKADISQADIVFIYLIPWKMEKLELFLKNQLRPGSIIVSNSFIFPKWKMINSDKKNHVFVYKI